MTPRALLAGVAVVVALVAQSAVLSHLTWQGVAPNLVLVVVVAAGLLRGSSFAMTLGFVAGLLLDLAPPADHAAGRWALALLVAGWVAGRVRADSTDAVRGARSERRSPPLGASLVTVAGCSFLATSIFALTGLVLRDPATGVGDLLSVVAVAVVLDVVVAAVLLLPLIRVLDRRSEAEDRIRVAT